MLPLLGIPMTAFLLRRLAPLRNGEVVLATTQLAIDDELSRMAEMEGFPVIRGSELDVVDRFVKAANSFGFDTVARVTADCPFVNAELVEWCLGRAAELDSFDLATTKRRFPVGLDVEIYRANLLAALQVRSLSAAEREHVTLYFYDHPSEFTVRSIAPPTNWPLSRRHYTVDTACDYEVAKAIAECFNRVEFSINDLLSRSMNCVRNNAN
jgi:spore coat polysaccharide biosynthesis protein SpsF